MRIILGLAATAAAAALGGTALAQRGPASSLPAPAAPGWSGGGHGPGWGAHRWRRPGMGHGGDRSGHHRRRFDHDERTLFFGYGAGLDAPYEEVDPHGTGFFAGAGGRIRTEGGRPYYDYDRAYPYEWASAAGGGREDRVGGEEGWSLLAPPRCSIEKGVRVCRGR